MPTTAPSRVTATIIALCATFVALPAGAMDPCLTPLIEDTPLCNPALAPTEWPISHGSDYAQGSSAFPGVAPGQAVLAEHVDLPGPPITLATSPAYDDGHHAIWGAVLGLTGAVVKIDSETFTLIDAYVPADEEVLPPTIPLGISGAYSVADGDFDYLLGRVDFVEIFGDSTPGDRSSEIELKKRVFLPETAFCRTTDTLVGGVMLPDRHLALVTEQAVVSVIPAEASLMEAANVVSLNSENGAVDCANDLAIPDEDLETVSNSIAADEHGNIYVVTNAAVIKYNWDGTSLTKIWRTEYLSDPPFSVLRLGPGSGSTPSLMGTAADDDRFVVITDGQELMHLVLMWRDDIPAGWTPIAPGRDPRIACEVPVMFGNALATQTMSEQSVLVRGYAAVSVNNLLSSEPSTGFPIIDTLLASLWGSDPALAPHGIERIDWDPIAQTCDTVWTNTEVSSPNGIPTMSAATGLMHAIGQRDGVWGLETLDFETGASVSIVPSAQTLCSQAVLDAISASALGPLIDPVIDPNTGTYPQTCENSVFAATEVGPDGTVYTGTFQGASRFTPNVISPVSLRRNATVGMTQCEDLAARGSAALPGDVDTARDMAKRGQTQLDAALAAVGAGTCPDLDASLAAAATGFMTSARAHLAAAEVAVDTNVVLAESEFDAARLDCSAGLAAELVACAPAAPSKDQEKCVNDMNKAYSKLAKTQGKEIQKCVKDGPKGKLTTSIEDCTTADAKLKVAKTEQKTIDTEIKKCTVAPEFGKTDAATVNQAAVDRELELAHQIFGPNLDATFISESKCQQSTYKQVRKCIDTQLKEFLKCKKSGLKGKEGPAGADLPFDDTSDLELCLGHDPKGKVLKACDTKLADTVVKACTGVVTSLAIPGCGTNDLFEVKDCVKAAATCRVCLGLNAADGMAVNCDLVDDGTVNASCF